MNRMVLDCSVTMTWCFEDESSPYGDTLLEWLKSHHALVPEIWLLEVTNVLLVAERRKRLTAIDSTRFLSLLQSLPIEIVPYTIWSRAGEFTTLGRQNQLSTYDTSYLSLALNQGLPLATLDTHLQRACQQFQVPLWQP